MPDKYKNKYRTDSQRLQNWDYAWSGAYFITICTHNRNHYFGEIENGEMKLSHSGIVANIMWYEIKSHVQNIDLGAFVVMPNHIHGILIIQNNETISADNNANITTGANGTPAIIGDNGAMGANAINDASGAIATTGIYGAMDGNGINGIYGANGIMNGMDAKRANEIFDANGIIGTSVTNGTIAATGINATFATNGANGTNGTNVETRHALSLLQPPSPQPSSPQLQQPHHPHPQPQIIDQPYPRTIGQQRFQNQGKHTVSSIIGGYKSAVTKHLHRLNYEFAWQSRFYDNIIRNENSYVRISDYIINNPARWNEDKFSIKQDDNN